MFWRFLAKQSRSTSAKRLERRRLFLEALESRLTPTTITVTTAADTVALDGAVSLREAILAANLNVPVNEAPAGAGADDIDFNIPGAGPFVLAVSSALPAITGTVAIDGLSQPGASPSNLLIILDGGLAGASAVGLTFSNHTASALIGLEVRSFGGGGVLLTGGGGHTVDLNWIGVDRDGTAKGNAWGVLIAADSTGNVIGTLPAGAGNLISGNTGDGVRVLGSGNTIQGNSIGVNLEGDAAVPNGRHGILLSGSNNQVLGTFTAGMRQTISGNLRDGIHISGNDNLVDGNTIGTNEPGNVGIGNGGAGVFIRATSTGNTIGTLTANMGNLISGNAGDGVRVDGSTNTVQGNFIGLDDSGVVGIPNGGNGVLLNGNDNQVLGTFTPGMRQVISGNALDGVRIAGDNNLVDGNTIGTDLTGTSALPNAGNGLNVRATGSNNTLGTPSTGNLISGNARDGVRVLGAANLVQGNFIGTNEAGNFPIPNGSNGVLLIGNDNKVLGTFSGRRQVISGNRLDGVRITGQNNLLDGNTIGTDLNGSVGLGNEEAGVYILASGSNNIIGTLTSGLGNLISGNRSNGMQVDGSFNVIEGNFIGVDDSGTVAVPNEANGVLLNGNRNQVRGTFTAGMRQVISGNNADGVRILGKKNLLDGNTIGTDLTGATAIGNGDNGVYILQTGVRNIIGTLISGQGNLISGNGADGVRVDGIRNTVQGNFIGTDDAGTAAIANGGNGVLLNGALNQVLGTFVAGMRQVISGNTNDGVRIAGKKNVLDGNSIGTDLTGSSAIPNGNNGVTVLLTSHHNAIGTLTAGLGNLVSGNANQGVQVDGNANAVQGNFIGVDVAGTGTVPNGDNGVLITGDRNLVVGTFTAGTRQVISGNGDDGIQIDGNSNLVDGNTIGTNAAGTADLGNLTDGVDINGRGNTVGSLAVNGGNLISGNGEEGVLIDGNLNRVLGNFIGVNVAGTGAIANSGNGVLINGSSNRVLGAFTAGARQVISGNVGNGVSVAGSNNLVDGNTIGTDLDGTVAVANGSDGVLVQNSATGNFIGTLSAGRGNLISGNTDEGVHVDGDFNKVLGNFIGVNDSGTGPLANGGNGVLLNGDNNQVLGTFSTGSRQVISGNTDDGVRIAGKNNLVDGNTIGTNADGSAPLANGGNGVFVLSTGIGNTIGTLALGNLISGNSDDGVQVDGNFNQIQGNFIGVNDAGTAALANGANGVLINGNNNQVIGTFVPGRRQVISGNVADGVHIVGNDNLISGNTIGFDVTGTVAIPNGGDPIEDLGVNNRLVNNLV